MFRKLRPFLRTVLGGPIKRNEIPPNTFKGANLSISRQFTSGNSTRPKKWRGIAGMLTGGGGILGGAWWTYGRLTHSNNKEVNKTDQTEIPSQSLLYALECFTTVVCGPKRKLDTFKDDRDVKKGRCDDNQKENTGPPNKQLELSEKFQRIHISGNSLEHFSTRAKCLAFLQDKFSKYDYDQLLHHVVILVSPYSLQQELVEEMNHYKSGGYNFSANAPPTLIWLPRPVQLVNYQRKSVKDDFSIVVFEQPVHVLVDVDKAGFINNVMAIWPTMVRENEVLNSESIKLLLKQFEFSFPKSPPS